MSLAQGFQTASQRGDVRRADLRGQHHRLHFRRSRAEISEVELEQTHPAPVPVAQRAQEIGQIPAVEEAQRAAIHGVAPLVRRIKLAERVGGDPQARLDAGLQAAAEPPVRPIRPVRLTPGAIPAVASVPEGVHEVVVEAHASRAQPQKLLQLLHRQLLGQLDVVGQLVIGGPVDVDGNRLVQHRCAPSV